MTCLKKIYFSFVGEWLWGQKRASDPRELAWELGLQMIKSPCGCWDPDLDPLPEQQVLLITDASLQPQQFLQQLYKMLGSLKQSFELMVMLLHLSPKF